MKVRLSFLYGLAAAFILYIMASIGLALYLDRNTESTGQRNVSVISAHSAHLDPEILNYKLAPHENIVVLVTDGQHDHVLWSAR